MSADARAGVRLLAVAVVQAAMLDATLGIACLVAAYPPGATLALAARAFPVLVCVALFSLMTLLAAIEFVEAAEHRICQAVARWCRP